MPSLLSILLVGLLTASVSYGQALTILCENDPPAQYVDESGELTGYTIRLVKNIQQLVGNNDEINLVPWARGYRMIKSEPNVVLFMMARTAERNAMFQWVGPVLELEFGLYAKSDSTIVINSIDDAKAVAGIGVYLDDARDQILTKAGFTNLDRTRKNILNVKKLMAGRIDLYAASSISYGVDAEAAGYKASDLKLVFPFHKIQVYIAMSKAMPKAVVNDWNDALADLRRQGRMEALMKEYYPTAKMPGPAITRF